jgi:hypothetical protein
VRPVSFNVLFHGRLTPDGQRSNLFTAMARTILHELNDAVFEAIAMMQQAQSAIMPTAQGQVAPEAQIAQLTTELKQATAQLKEAL